MVVTLHFTSLRQPAVAVAVQETLQSAAKMVAQVAVAQVAHRVPRPDQEFLDKVQAVVADQRVQMYLPAAEVVKMARVLPVYRVVLEQAETAEQLLLHLYQDLQ
jgi:hypothetical protein